MEDKLRSYMDYLFKDVPPTKKAVELKEEILQNLVDKYRDLRSEGKTEEAAYNIAIASIGDIGELLDALKHETPDNSQNNPSDEYMCWKKRSAVLVATAVTLYILCVVPVIISEEVFHNDVAGPCLMFVFIAAATGLLIYNNMSKPSRTKKDDTLMDDFKEWKSQNEEKKQALKSIKSAVWSIVTVLYFIISFTTGAWYITWVIFLLGGAVESIIRAIFDLRS